VESVYRLVESDDYRVPLVFRLTLNSGQGEGLLDISVSDLTTTVISAIQPGRAETTDR